MRLWDLPQGQEVRPKIYGLDPFEYPGGWIEFDHLDGMYSLCIAFDGEGNRLGICHLAGSAPLEPYLDGYRLKVSK